MIQNVNLCRLGASWRIRGLSAIIVLIVSFFTQLMKPSRSICTIDIMRSILFQCLSSSAVLCNCRLTKLIVFLAGILISFFSVASEDFLQSNQSAVQLEEKEPAFLPVSEAFALSLSYKNPNIVEASWKIEEGYYLYRHQFKVLAASDAIQIGSLEIAPGIRKVDEWFGEVEVYYSQASLIFEILGAGGEDASEFNLTFQGCADAGLCYPPVTIHHIHLRPIIHFSFKVFEHLRHSSNSI